MMRSSSALKGLLAFTICISACKSRIKEQDDEVYSRHLQRHVQLKVISTPMPDQKEDMNLLLINDAGELANLDARDILDSLYKAKAIQPLLIVGIAADASREYGWGEDKDRATGSRAAGYHAFVNNELYPFVKKKAVTRKFHSVAIFGSGLAAISALDIAWQHDDKIQRLGMIDPAIDYAGITDSIPNFLRSLETSRKRPHLEYWICPGNNVASATNTRQLIHTLNEKNQGPVMMDSTATSRRNQFANFLLWAYGK